MRKLIQFIIIRFFCIGVHSPETLTWFLILFSCLLFSLLWANWFIDLNFRWLDLFFSNIIFFKRIFYLSINFITNISLRQIEINYEYTINNFLFRLLSIARNDECVRRKRQSTRSKWKFYANASTCSIGVHFMLIISIALEFLAKTAIPPAHSANWKQKQDVREVFMADRTL